MRQLDLFGSFSEMPAQEEKPEDIRQVLEKEGMPDVIVNKEIPSSLVDITTPIPRLEALNDQVKTGENADQVSDTKEGLEYGSSFPSPEIADIQNNFAAANTEEGAVDASVNEADVKRQAVFPIDSKELKTDHFVEKKEAAFEETEMLVEIEKEPFSDTGDTKTNQIKEPEKRGRKSLEHIQAEVDLIEVPEDEVLFKKQYYQISEVARWFRVNASLLRFWEKEFDILKPKKNGKGDRLFRPEDVKNLQLIYQLLRQRKYTIEGAKEYIKSNRKKADVEMQLADTLQKFKSFLLDLKANL